VPTGTFPTVGGARGETSVTLATDLLVAVVLGSQDLERRLDDTTAETMKYQERGQQCHITDSGDTDRSTK
jgi:hypothetical protein